MRGERCRRAFVQHLERPEVPPGLLASIWDGERLAWSLCNALGRLDATQGFRAAVVSGLGGEMIRQAFAQFLGAEKGQMSLKIPTKLT